MGALVFFYQAMLKEPLGRIDGFRIQRRGELRVMALDFVRRQMAHVVHGIRDRPLFVFVETDGRNLVRPSGGLPQPSTGG